MRGRALLAAVLVLAGVFSLGIALSQLHPQGWFSRSSPPGGGALPPSEPTDLAIPSLAVQASVRGVGLDESGAIAAPDMGRAQDETGWYRAGPTPGQHGAAVIVGHVDDGQGPAVFAELGSLRPGDRIEVTRRDSSVAVFAVTEVRSFDRRSLPPEIYGDFSAPELLLITCAGPWDPTGGYSENLVVFARLLENSQNGRNS